MRNAMTLVMMVPLVSCTTGEVATTNEAGSEISSYEVARTMAADLASPDRGGATGAFFDGAMLAHGGTPVGFFVAEDGITRGRHDGTDYLYRVYCRDAYGTTMDTCGRKGVSATVIATWEETRGMSAFASTTRHDVMWTLDGLDEEFAAIRGVGTVSGSVTFTRGGSAMRYSLAQVDTYNLRLDMGSYGVVGGTFDTDLTAKPAGDVAANDIHGLVMFERASAPMLIVDGETFPLDLTTGDVQVILY